MLLPAASRLAEQAIKRNGTPREVAEAIVFLRRCRPVRSLEADSDESERASALLGGYQRCIKYKTPTLTQVTH